MTLLALLIVLLIVGVTLALVPIDPDIKRIIIILVIVVVVVVLIIFLLRIAGIPDIKLF
jgi:hypothetical protein